MAKHLTRRHLLGSLGAGALCTLGGLGGTALATSGVQGNKKLLYVYVHGAWDPVYTFDPKPDSPYVDDPSVDRPTDNPTDVESVEQIQGHRVAINPFRRPAVAQFFEAWGHRTLSLVGVTIGGIAHYPNRLRILTGGTDRTRPDLVSILGHYSSVTEPFGAIDLSGWSFHGPHGATLSRVGFNWQLRNLLQPGNVGIGEHLTADTREDDLVEAYLRRRALARSHEAPLQRWPIDLSASIDRLEILRDHRAELAQLFDRSPRNADDNLDLAVDLLAGGWARSVLVDTRYYFDTHARNSDQSSLNNNLFGSLHRMLDRMESEGLLDDTLVLVTSEMTRSGRQNSGGGKDHWPLLANLLIGGGTVGGRTMGQTDELLAPRPVDLHTGQLDPEGMVPRYDHFFAGLLTHLGIDAAEHMPGVTPLRGFDQA